MSILAERPQSETALQLAFTLSRLNQDLDEVRNASESTWDKVKIGFQKTYESSREGFQNARQWVSDKVAP